MKNFVLFFLQFLKIQNNLIEILKDLKYISKKLSMCFIEGMLFFVWLYQKKKKFLIFCVKKINYF